MAVNSLRPLLLGKLDEMVQNDINAASNRGAVITRSVAISTAKALMKRHPNIFGNIDLDNSHWAQSLFQRIGFKRRRVTTSKLEIPTGVRKEAKLLFHHSIVEKVEECSIPKSLILNFDQTPSKFVPVSSSTLAKRNSKQVRVKGCNDKCAITLQYS